MLSTLEETALPGHRPRSRWRAVVAALAAAVIAPVVLSAPPAAAATPTTYQDHVYASKASDPSADKPQSKLWYNDGAWWAVMAGTSTINIYKLGADHVWTDTGVVVDRRLNSTADALWNPDGTLLLASRTRGSKGRVKVTKFTYSTSSGRYSKVSGFPKTLPGGGTESVTLDRDSLGRIWVTFTRDSAVWVTHSTSATASSFVTPFRIPGLDTAVAPDDISAIIAFSGKVGVMWSDQVDTAVRFAVHDDDDPDDTWSIESPLAGTRLADDHINLKSLLGDDLGRVHAAVKTSLGDSPSDPPSSPGLLVLSRAADGTWTNAVAATIADDQTRPQIVLDKTNKQIYVMQSDEGGGSVHFKSSPLGSISFGSGKGTPLIEWPGANINNVSTAKDPVTAATGIVAIAADSDAHRYYHAEMGVDGTPPPPPPGDTTPPTVTAQNPADGSTGAATSSAVTATFSEPVDPGTVTSSSFTLTGPAGAVAGSVAYDATSTRATFTPSGALTASTTYNATVTTDVTDVVGNPLASNSAWSFTTAGSSGTTVTLNAIADSYVRSTDRTANFGNDAVLQVDKSPVEMAYVKFDLTPYAGRTLVNATLHLQVTTSGSTGKQNVKPVADDSWTETGLTYANKPRVGTTIGTLSKPSANSAYDIALTTSAVAGELGEQLSLGMKTGSSNGVVLASRETSTPPQLVLELG